MDVAMKRIMVLKIVFILFFNCMGFGNFKEIKISAPDLIIGVEGVNGEDDNYIFGEIVDIQLDLQGNIYVLDRKRCRIQVFNENGRFIKTIGRKGQGPGEFYLPMRFFIKSEILVLDFRTIDIFSLEGKFIKSFKIDFYATDIKVNKKDEIILLGLLNDKIFHIFSKEGKLLYSFGEPFKIPFEYLDRYNKYKDSPFLKVHVQMFLIDDEIFIFNPFKYKIRHYKNNQCVREFGREIENYRTPVVTDFGSKGYSIGYIAAPTIIKLSDNLLLIWREFQIDFFEKYKFVRSISTPELKGLGWTIDGKNRIYCIDSLDYPKVIRYTSILK